MALRPRPGAPPRTGRTPVSRATVQSSRLSREVQRRNRGRTRPRRPLLPHRLPRRRLPRRERRAIHVVAGSVGQNCRAAPRQHDAAPAADRAKARWAARTASTTRSSATPPTAAGRITSPSGAAATIPRPPRDGGVPRPASARRSSSAAEPGRGGRQRTPPSADIRAPPPAAPPSRRAPRDSVVAGPAMRQTLPRRPRAT